MSCRIKNESGRFINGTLRYLGQFPGLVRDKTVLVAGLELDHEETLGTDGSFLGVKYFSTIPKRGYFVEYEDCQ